MMVNLNYCVFDIIGMKENSIIRVFFTSNSALTMTVVTTLFKNLVAFIFRSVRDSDSKSELHSFVRSFWQQHSVWNTALVGKSFIV